MYHYVREPEEWKGSVPISPKAFEEQIDQIGKTHEFVLPDDLTKITPKPKCVLTFDDATRDQYEIAFDIMKRKGVPGYFTVMSGPLLEGEIPVFHLVHAALSSFSEELLWNQLCDHLTQKELSALCQSNNVYAYEKSQLRRYIKYTLNFIFESKQSKEFLEKMVFNFFGSKENIIQNMYISIKEFKKMKQAGMSIGVHGANHIPFNGRASEYFNNEIAPCAKFIQDNLNFTPSWYTPPFGGGENKVYMIEKLKKQLQLAGYKGAFTTNSGKIYDPSSFWLDRIDCNRINLLNL